MLKFKNIKYIANALIMVITSISQLSYAETYDETLLSIQNKIKEYDSIIAKDVELNLVEEKKASEEFIKEDLNKKTKIKDLGLANEKLGKEIEEQINKSQQFEKAIGELKVENKEEIKRVNAKQKRNKAIHDTQTVIAKQWQENSNEVNSILATIVDDSVVSNIKCIIEAKVTSDGLISDAMVVRPSVFGLFDGIAQRTVMETGYVSLPEGMTSAKIVFTKHKAVMQVDDDK